MDTESAAKIKARMEELPEDVRAAIQSAEVGKHLQEVGTKYKLHIDQIETLGNETYLVMLGFTEPDEFAENIQKEVKVPNDQANLIAQDISNTLFVPIRESMQRFAEEQALHSSVLQPETTPAAPKQPLSSVLPVASMAKTPEVTPMPTVPVPTAPIAPVAETQKTPPAVDLHAADMMLSQKTVSAPAETPTVAPIPKPDLSKSEPPKPGNYKTDPYREPVE